MKVDVYSQLAMAVLLLTFAGCGANRQPTEAGSSGANSRPVTVMRLDREIDMVLARQTSQRVRLSRLQSRLQEHQTIYAAVGHSDTATYSRLLSQGNNQFTRSNELTREFFSHRDLTSEINEYYADILNALETHIESPPVFYLVYGFENGTNARTESFANRNFMRILLNLNTLRTPGAFELAARHELVHVLKPAFGETLLEICMNEGVASWISLVTHCDFDQSQTGVLPIHECLFWDRQTYSTAAAMKSELIKEFERLKDRKTRDILRQFTYLNYRPERVPNAPSRAGYYVGLLAVQAWAKKNPSKSLRHLLDATPLELWEALKESEKD